jgi:eukaryotic-like serine/threonine-protein kinase
MQGGTGAGGPTPRSAVGQDPTLVEGVGPAGLAGRVVGDRYRLDRLIGAGGMAQVWESTDAVLGRRVAVKVLHPHLAENEAFVRRFRQEAVAAARLNHPGIVGVYDTCSDHGIEAIVMEYLDATTLRQLLDERGVLDPDTTTRIGLRLLDALEAAHRAGLVHRDVKPSNVLLCADGRVKITDFGIAKAEDTTDLTNEGSLVGTANYLAPEQLLGQEVDGRADLYALGLVLYECLTGRLPFRGDTGAAAAVARLHTDPPDPRRIRASIPPALAATVMRALEREPVNRFDAAQFRAALLAGGGPPTPVADDTGVLATAEGPDATGYGRSERRWLVPALVVVLLGVAVTVAGLLLRDTTTPSSTPPTTATPTPGAGSGAAVPIAAVSTFDPNGRGTPGENDRLAPDAVDGDPRTAWRTETYESAAVFRAKEGVGLVLEFDEPTALSSLQLSGSTNGWEASLFPLADQDRLAGDGPNAFDPTDADPVTTIGPVRGSVTVDLGGVITGRVLVWITSLGDPVDGGGLRADVAEVEVFGTTR